MDPFDDDEEGKWKTAAAAFAIRERNLRGRTVNGMRNAKLI